MEAVAVALGSNAAVPPSEATVLEVPSQQFMVTVPATLQAGQAFELQLRPIAVAIPSNCGPGSVLLVDVSSTVALSNTEGAAKAEVITATGTQAAFAATGTSSFPAKAVPQPSWITAWKHHLAKKPTVIRRAFYGTGSLLFFTALALIALGCKWV
jgi:hypothetical protein